MPCEIFLVSTAGESIPSLQVGFVFYLCAEAFIFLQMLSGVLKHSLEAALQIFDPDLKF